MKITRYDVAGAVLGAVLSLTAMRVVDAQTATPRIHADAGNACAWDQPAQDLASAQAMHVSQVFDGGASTAVTQTCAGSVSPFTCSVPVPLSEQSVGTHTLVISGQNVDSIDGTLSSPTELVSLTYTVVPPLVTPQPGLNPRIVKILGTVIAVLVGVFAFFGHH